MNPIFNKYFSDKILDFDSQEITDQLLRENNDFIYQLQSYDSLLAQRFIEVCKDICNHFFLERPELFLEGMKTGASLMIELLEPQKRKL